MFLPGAGPDEGGARRGGADTYNPKDTNKNAQRKYVGVGTAELAEPGPPLTVGRGADAH